MNIQTRMTNGKATRSRLTAISVSVCFAALALLLAQRTAFSSETAVVIAPPALDEPISAATVHEETAVFAGGCFWGVQGVFQHVRGVKQAVSRWPPE